MSKLIVEVCRVDTVEPHPNADRLAIATVKGWRTCIKKDPETGRPEFEPGDKCIYFPPDAILPAALAHGPSDDPPGRLGIMNYLNPLPTGEDGIRPKGGRVKAARLRGVPSYGVIMPLTPEHGDDPEWVVGTNLAEYFGVAKWEPPLESAERDAEPDHPRFHRYTDIENIGNYPHAIADGAEVIITEKIHGKNCRVGLVLDSFADNQWIFCVGSHSVRRKELDADGNRSEFWEVLTPNVRRLLEHVRDEMLPEQPKLSVVLFGEVYGSGVQDMAYGLATGARAFRAFDIAVNGLFLDFDVKAQLLERFAVQAVPVLYRGPFTRSIVEEHTAGPTTLCDAEKAGKFKGREGVVITPAQEVDYSEPLNGRLILKSVSADYLARKGGTDSH